MDKQKEEEEKKDRAAILLEERKKAIYNLVLLFAAAFVVLIGILTMAWFAKNQEGGTSGMGVKPSKMPFEIATYGTEGTRNESIINQVASEYKTGNPTTIEGLAYYKTSAGTDAIKLRYNAGESEIGPGGSGVLELYLVSKVDGALSVDIDLDVTAYVTVDKYDLDESGNKIQETDENDELVYEEDGTTPVYRTTPTLMAVSDVTTTNCNISSTYLATLQSAASYIKGHIMFFMDEGDMVNVSTDPETVVIDVDRSFYYKDPIISRKYEWSVASTEVDEVHYIPIYWMWPNTLGQILLDGNYNMRSGIPLVKDADNTVEKTAMATYLINNKSIVFTNAIDIADAGIINHPTQDNFDLMSAGYNGADFLIGSSIDYFLIEVTVSLHTDNN